MKPITPVSVLPLTKSLHLTLTDQRVVFPDDLQAKVDAYWQTRVQQNPHLFNGEVFSTTTYVETADSIEVTLAQTNFAHCLYNEAFAMGEYAYRVIHTACLVVSGDDKLIVGQMSQDTARPGIICCSGGSLDRGDVRDDNSIDLDYSTIHEVREELGLDPQDAHVQKFAPAYLKTGGPGNKVTILYELHTSLTSKEIADNYAKFTATLTQENQEIEFEKLHYIDNTPAAVEAFIAEHTDKLDAYIPDLFRLVSQR